MNKELRPEILTAARTLFNECGYNEVSMRDIANSLHISVGNLTYYYKTKKELVEAVVLERHSHYQKPVPYPTIEALDGFFQRLLNHQRENIYYFRHFKQLAHLSDTVYQIQLGVMENTYEALGGSFAALRTSGVMVQALLPNQTEHLIDAILSVFTYGTLRNMDGRRSCVWSLIYPLLTEVGRTEFQDKIRLDE